MYLVRGEGVLSPRGVLSLGVREGVYLVWGVYLAPGGWSGGCVVRGVCVCGLGVCGVRGAPPQFFFDFLKFFF